MDKIAVVILNWNGAEMLSRFLPSVSACSPQATIYVADNGSTDNSVNVVRTDFPQVNLICLDRNYGFADGYNKALAQIHAEYFVLLNSDVEVSEGWLRPMLAYMDDHEEVAACQPKLLAYNDRLTFEYAGGCGGYMDRYGYPFCRGRVMGTVEKDEGQYDEVQSLFWATGAALLIRSTDYLSVGGLDGRFFAHMEEIDLCWRLRSRGRGIVCVPQSVVYHVGAATLKKENPKKTFLNFRNNLLMLYKNLPAHEVRHVMAVRCLLDYLAALQFVLTGNIAGARAIVAARREFKRIRTDFIPQRKENLQRTVGIAIPERTSFSLLWQYYFMRRKRWTDLPIKE
jgi:GT2 family glycosyltransferase